MKICFFSINAYSAFNPKREAPIGGTEIQLFNIAHYLARDPTFDVNFITGDWGQPPIEIFGNMKVVRSFSLRKSLSNCIKAPFLLLKSLKKVNADVYIASSAGIEIGIIALFCKIFRKNFIFRTASSVDCNTEKIKKLGKIVGTFYKFGLKNASIVIVQNSEDKKNLMKFHKKKSKIIKNSFEIPKFEIKERDYILWVGSARKVKRPEIFFEIAKKNPRENFVMILSKSGDAELWERLLSEASHISNLKLIPGVPFSESQNYFSKAKLLVGTSEYEGFPNVYVQACMAGVPIISLAVNPDDFITENDLGYVADNVLGKLLGQIRGILLDNKDYLSKSKNGYQYAKNTHSIKENIEKWKEIISFQ